MKRYYCAKIDGLKLENKFYPIGKEITDGGKYRSFIKWGWVRVEGDSEPVVVNRKKFSRKQSRSKNGKANKR